MNYTLITGLGRSGSKWLSTLLFRLKPKETVVGHEILFDYDIKGWANIAKGSWNGPEFWKTRNKLLRKKAKYPETLIEVNSVPRHFLEGFHEVYPEGRIGLLVRDPRKVVRSISDSAHYRDPSTTAPCRRPDPAWVGFTVPGWERLPRVAKISWMWVMANQAVLPRATHQVRLEDLVTFYGVITKLCEWCGLTPNREIWEKLRNTPLNTRPRKCPPFEEWKSQDQQMLLSICGDTMRRFGY